MSSQNAHALARLQNAQSDQSMRSLHLPHDKFSQGGVQNITI